MTLLTNGKSLVTTRTFWGGLISLLPLLAKGLEVTGVIPPGIVDPAVALVTSTLGGLISIYGRIVATKQITSLL